MKKIFLFLLMASPFAAKSQDYIDNQITTMKTGDFWINGSGVLKTLHAAAPLGQGQIGFHKDAYLSNSANRRWVLGITNTETGSGDVGGDFTLWNYNDAGAFKGTVFSVTRSSGTANFHNGINMVNASTNYIFYTAAGYGAPAFTTRSLGSKIVLSPSVTTTTTDYAIGLQKNGANTEAWFGMPENTVNQVWNFYGGTSKAGRIDGKGNTQWEGQGRFKGWFLPGSGDGPAAELGVTGTMATLIGFNRTTNSYMPLYLAAGSGGVVKYIHISQAGVGIGTQTPQSELSVNGTITAQKVKVTTAGWADYVFLPDYQLPTLPEVERHIREKGHLKDIPSEKEVEKEGVDVGEMNKKLLAKVEELTLYLIEQNKKLEALEKWKAEQEEKAGK